MNIVQIRSLDKGENEWKEYLVKYHTEIKEECIINIDFVCLETKKTQPTEFYPPKFGLELEANRGWYVFSRNLLAGGIRDF